MGPQRQHSGTTAPALGGSLKHGLRPPQPDAARHDWVWELSGRAQGNAVFLSTAPVAGKGGDPVSFALGWPLKHAGGRQPGYVVVVDLPPDALGLVHAVVPNIELTAFVSVSITRSWLRETARLHASRAPVAVADDDGQTPVLRVKLTHDHLSAISGITLDGRLFLQVREDSYDGAAVVGFLRVLLRKIPGKVLVIWDGSPIHKGLAVKEFLKQGAAKRLHLERLPGYAPDLNPDEGVWNYLKRVELANLCCQDLAALALALRSAKERLRHKRMVIQAWIRQAGCHV